MTGRLFFVGVVLSWVAGCASSGSATRAPPPGAPASEADSASFADDAGLRIAAAAQRLVGSAYRFGAAGPDQFDCSGLVYFVHRAVGVDVPRTALTQFRVANPVSPSGLEPGDVVFFSDGADQVTHVGVFIGRGEFVHAPKSGRPVTYARLADDYYQASFAGAGRLHGAPAAASR